MIESFKSRIATIMAGLRGKTPQKAESNKDRQDNLGATKRYKLTREGELQGKAQSYLITDSGEILLQPGFLVGRGNSCHLKLTDLGSSRVHASFSLVSEGWLLKDNSSKNGTFVNGVPIRSAVLRSGDQILIGQTLLIYEER